MMDLYKILGVPKNATKDEVKRAYRRKAKVHHPDAGGDPKNFKALVTAYTILFDEEKRRRYDDGESPESITKATMTEDQEIMTIVMSLFVQLVPNCNPKKDNVPKMMANQIAQNIAQIEEQIKAGPKVIQKFDEVLKRLKVKKDDEENPFVGAAERGKSETQKRIDDLKRQKRLGQKAAEYLEAFDYQVDKMKQAIVEIRIGGVKMEGVTFGDITFDTE
jgi:curved DNA-binding protein CbpA